MQKTISARDWRTRSPRIDLSLQPLGTGTPPIQPATLIAARLSAQNSGQEDKRLAPGKLLIVEDEFLTGQDLACWPQREGIEVLGPFSTIDGAIEVVRTTNDISAAIVDLNIRGRLAFDLAEHLIEKHITFIFYTGYDSVIIPERFRSIGRVRKPASWPEIKQALLGAPSKHMGEERLVKQIATEAGDISLVLPVLQRRAREITSTPEMASRLVENTLERAIIEVATCPAGVSMQSWLLRLLETTGIGERRHIQ